MESMHNLIEYYDELYPVTQEQFNFFDNLVTKFSKPARFLNIGCGTGLLENHLARDVADVTGLETIKELIDSATRKHRNQLMAVRFFQMSTLEMVRFLGKGFYDVISCLNDRITFIHDQVLLRKFFFDSRQLLAEGGMIALQLTNYDLFKNKLPAVLPERSSIRVTLNSKLDKTSDENYVVTKNIKTGNGKTLPVYQNTPVYPITQNEIVDFAKEAGFNTVEFYADYNLTPFSPDCKEMLVIIK